MSTVAASLYVAARNNLYAREIALGDSYLLLSTTLTSSDSGTFSEVTGKIMLASDSGAFSESARVGVPTPSQALAVASQITASLSGGAAGGAYIPVTIWNLFPLPSVYQSQGGVSITCGYNTYNLRYVKPGDVIEASDVSQLLNVYACMHATVFFLLYGAATQGSTTANQVATQVAQYMGTPSQWIELASVIQEYASTAVGILPNSGVWISGEIGSTWNMLQYLLTTQEINESVSPPQFYYPPAQSEVYKAWTQAPSPSDFIRRDASLVSSLIELSTMLPLIQDGMPALHDHINMIRNLAIMLAGEIVVMLAPQYQNLPQDAQSLLQQLAQWVTAPGAMPWAPFGVEAIALKLQPGSIMKALYIDAYVQLASILAQLIPYLFNYYATMQITLSGASIISGLVWCSQ